MTWWAVALGAAIGAPARYLVDRAVSRRTGQPWGTLVVNLTGCALLGVLTGLLARGMITATPFSLLGVGFCGAYTTFSTFVWECLALAEERRVRVAVVNVVASVVVGVLLAYGTYLLAAPRTPLSG